MELRFRPDDDNKSSPGFSVSSGDNYFTEQALRAGYMTNGIRIAEFMRNSDPVGEAFQREMEKNRIREEIIAAEIIRKRALEAEVRRELAMERGLTIRREEGFSFVGNSSCPSMWTDPRGSLLQHLHRHHRQPDDSRVSEERLSFPTRPEIGEVESFPFQRHPDAAKVTEVNKGSVMFIAKPTNTNLVGIKRNVAAIGGTELTGGSSKKKPQKEWTCAICQVSATSEQGLNDHLKGKKHRTKEAEFKKNGAASKHADTLQKKSDNSEMAEIISSLKPSDGKRPLQVKKKVVKKKRGAAGAQKTEKTENLRKKFKFWCEHCQIGCHSATVMGDHERGKKHIAHLQAAKQDGGDVPVTSTNNTNTNTNTEATAGKGPVEEVNEETMENVDGEVDGGEEEEAQEEVLEMKATVDEVVGEEEIGGEEDEAKEEEEEIGGEEEEALERNATVDEVAEAEEKN